MQSIIYLITAVVMAVVLILMIRLYSKSKAIWTLAAGSVVFGLIVDNATLGLGRFIGEGDTLKMLSYPRFWLHGLFTPLIIMFVWYVMRRSGNPSMQGMKAYAIFGTLTLVMIALGLRTDVFGLSLKFAQEGDVLRYTYAVSSGPPIPAISAILVAIFAGVILGVRKKWWELAVGSAIMFVLTAARVGGVLENIGELALVLGCYLTDRRFIGKYVPFKR